MLHNWILDDAFISSRATQIIQEAHFTNMDSLILAWISNHMHSAVWDEITYPFPISMASPLRLWNGWVISLSLYDWCNDWFVLGLILNHVSKTVSRIYCDYYSHHQHMNICDDLQLDHG